MLTCSDVPKIYFNHDYNSIENVIVLTIIRLDNEMLSFKSSSTLDAQQCRKLNNSRKRWSVAYLWGTG